MSLVHVGIRPEYEIVRKTDKLKGIMGLAYEIFPNGAYRVWTDRMLKSGCNNEIKEINKSGDLIYCPYCDELFSKDQFKEKDNVEGKSIQQE